MATYTTVQGDTWDSIAYAQCGDEKYMKYLIEANWAQLETLVFSADVELELPDIPEEAEEDIPFWRDPEVVDAYEAEDE